ncbi:MAG: hypothetical protein PHC62_02745 [Candidatus Izemoplasmatales bacterium]|nr:hypothetical protein [Candidatus Izemoplasmatales bacterium]
MSILVYASVIIFFLYPVLSGVLFFKISNFKLAMVFGNVPIVIMWLLYIFSTDPFGEYFWIVFYLVPLTLVTALFIYLRVKKEDRAKFSEIDKMKIHEL